MDKLRAQIAAHPLRNKPYNAIKFAGVDHMRTPLYRVAKGERTMGASEALKTAFQQFGGHCFHCQTWVPAEELSQAFTRDHLRPQKDGGGDHLHNLVFACFDCNQSKGGTDLISFNVERAAEYLKALEVHVERCVDVLRKTAPKG